MKRAFLLIFTLTFSLQVRAWWDPGHLVTAMIAYMYLDDDVKKRVDELTVVLQRDYPYINHFITTGPWPDDLKAEGVHTFDTWHYTNIPYNPNRVALPPQPEVDIIWAINETSDVLRARRARDVDKARNLAFLVHFVADLHQPLHSTSVFSNPQPGGNIGGNAFPLQGNWRNMHMLWDDGCGFLSSYNDINPYGKEKEPLEEGEIQRLKELADQLVAEFPEDHFAAIDVLDPDFWALESHKLAVKYGYRGVNSVDSKGWKTYIAPDDEPSEMYLEKGQAIVKERLALGGYRLARMLNEIFGE